MTLCRQTCPLYSNTSYQENTFAILGSSDRDNRSVEHFVQLYHVHRIKYCSIAISCTWGKLDINRGLHFLHYLGLDYPKESLIKQPFLS